jgi:hypothetical protein
VGFVDEHRRGRVLRSSSNESSGGETAVGTG